jgi:hypothetical protein
MASLIALWSDFESWFAAKRGEVLAACMGRRRRIGIGGSAIAEWGSEGNSVGLKRKWSFTDRAGGAMAVNVGGRKIKSGDGGKIESPIMSGLLFEWVRDEAEIAISRAFIRALPGKAMGMQEKGVGKKMQLGREKG